MRFASASSIAILGIIVFIPLPADAISQVEPTISWHFKNFIQDAQEFFTINPTAKAQLKLQHAQDLQNQIDTLDNKGIEIPEEVERRRLQKLGEAQNIVESSVQDAKTTLQNVIDQMKSIGELNQIRILHSQFANIVQNGTPDEKKAFEAKVNALDTWNKYCIGDFSLSEFDRPTKNSWTVLKQKCPVLNSWEKAYGIDGIRQQFGGY